MAGDSEDQGAGEDLDEFAVLTLLENRPHHYLDTEIEQAVREFLSSDEEGNNKR